MSSLEDLEVRHLSALRAVASEGTFGKAAQRLGYTQSAISQQIAALEKVLGVDLFDRQKGPRAPILTVAGESMLKYACELLDRIDDIDIELDALRRGEAGRLVVGTFQSVSAEIMPALFGKLRVEAPGIELRLFESDDQTVLLERLRNRDLDITFTAYDPEEVGLIHHPMGTDRFVVIAPASEAIDVLTVDPADLAGKPMIGQTNSCQLLIDEGLTKHTSQMNYIFSTQDNGAVQGMVRSGMGWAVMPELAIDPHDEGIRVLTLDPPITPRKISLTQLADRAQPKAADTFIRLATEICGPILHDLRSESS